MLLRHPHIAYASIHLLQSPNQINLLAMKLLVDMRGEGGYAGMPIFPPPATQKEQNHWPGGGGEGREVVIDRDVDDAADEVEKDGKGVAGAGGDTGAAAGIAAPCSGVSKPASMTAELAFRHEALTIVLPLGFFVCILCWHPPSLVLSLQFAQLCLSNCSSHYIVFLLK